MCTVTYIPSAGNFFFTSSRDEQTGRQLADLPVIHEIDNHRLLFPKDPQGGGTWIVAHESGNIGVLLNGADFVHQPLTPYLKSRGIVLLDLMIQIRPVKAFENADFKQIEPFTAILFDNKKLYICKWNGTKKNILSHNENEPGIWSSVTLYDPGSISIRESWFKEWVNENPVPDGSQILRFHQEAGNGDPTNNILMNRNGKVFTNSISSICVSGDSADFQYLDLRRGNSYYSSISFRKKNFLQV
jgi:Transport and Golgi organisation 2